MGRKVCGSVAHAVTAGAVRCSAWLGDVGFMWRKGSSELTPDVRHALSTNPRGANEELLEMRRRGNREEILRWLQTPQSTSLLLKCEAAGLTPQQVANPEMLLPRGARACRRLSRWMTRAQFLFVAETSKCWADFCAARDRQDMAVKENQPIWRRILTTPPTL